MVIFNFYKDILVPTFGWICVFALTFFQIAAIIAGMIKIVKGFLKE